MTIEKEGLRHNRRLAKKRVQYLNKILCFGIKFCAGRLFSNSRTVSSQCAKMIGNINKKTAMRNIITLFNFIVLISCNDQTENKYNWKSIRVTVDNHHFFVTPERDSLFYMNDNGLATLDSTNKAHKASIANVKYFLSKAERDSLYSYCNQAIISQTTAESKVIDDAGQYLLIEIVNEQNKLTCKYAISSWEYISPAMKGIERLTYGKLNEK